MTFPHLIFDLYGTLVDIHTEENALTWEKTALFFGFHGASYTADSLHAAFDAAMKAREAKAGQNYECFPDIPFDQVMAQLFREKNIMENADALGFQAAQLFRITSIEYIRLYPHVPEALQALRDQGHHLWLLSNAQQAFTAYELRLLKLNTAFHGILLSSDYQCRKPDARFFRALIDGQHLDPKECLMIGNDRDTDIAGAKNLGLATLYMHTNLTPSPQAPANPALHPSCLKDGRHWEYEGWDWKELSAIIHQI